MESLSQAHRAWGGMWADPYALKGMRLELLMKTPAKDRGALSLDILKGWFSHSLKRFKVGLDQGGSHP